MAWSQAGNTQFPIHLHGIKSINQQDGCPKKPSCVPYECSKQTQNDGALSYETVNDRNTKQQDSSARNLPLNVYTRCLARNVEAE